MSDRKEEDLGEKGKERNKSPRTKQFLGRSGRWLFFLLVLMQELVLCRCGNLDGKSLQERVEAVKRSWLVGMKWEEEKKSRCAFFKWFSFEYRKEVHEKIQRHL